MPLEREKIRSALEKKGFKKDEKNRDHDYYFLQVAGKKSSVFTKLSRGSNYKTIGDGLVAKIAKQIFLTRSQFEKYVSCSMSREDYLEAVRARGVRLD